MTTATTLGDAVFSLNMTRGEDFLYKSKVDFGGKVAKASFRVNFLVPLLAILVHVFFVPGLGFLNCKMGDIPQEVVVKTERSRGRGLAPVDAH
ncbi:noncompact myelin associated protein [Cricetulus griseus]